MTTRVLRCAAAVLLALTLQVVLSAHDIPDEIAVQSYVRPQENQLQVLLRIPLLAVTQANLPKDGVGYLALPYIDPALREAANQISNGIVFLEGDERLTRYELANARISLPSDRSFDTYNAAIASVRGAKLADATKVYYNQGFLDLELHFPIQSPDSPFSMRVLFGRGLANRTATYINFIRPDGGVRAFRIHDDTPLVRLDPKTHQAAWVFLKAGFYRFLDGLDHLLFVIVLALPFRRVRDLIKPFVAFAIAHSITLAFAAFGLGAIAGASNAAAALGWPDTWFAPTIGALVALSLVYVSVENGIGVGLKHRWVVALVFGLFHGLGFAIALQETLQFAGSHAIAALLSYNLGLELGTLIILAIVVPAASLLFSQVVPERAGIIVASVLVGHIGWHWMTERAAIAKLSSWPLMDLNLMLTVVRWLLAIAVIGGAAWFIAGLLKKKTEPELPEKSIVDKLAGSR